MRKTALILIMLTLSVILANLTAQEARAEDSNGQVVDAIVSDTEIVIDDQTYRIASDADFRASDGKTIIDFSYFNEGDEVEFILNDTGEIILLSRSKGQ